MRYYTREEQDKAAQAQINVLREAAGMHQGVKQVMREFDGKCFNCRLEKALQARVNRHIYVEKTGYHICLYYYHNGQHITLAVVKPDDLPEGKRLPGEKLIASVRDQREKLLKEAAELEQDMKNIDMIRAQLESLKKAIQATENQLKTHAAKDIYGLRVSVRIG